MHFRGYYGYSKSSERGSMKALGSGDKGLGFELKVVGLRVLGLGLGILGLRVLGLGFRALGLVLGLRLGFGLRVFGGLGVEL